MTCLVVTCAYAHLNNHSLSFAVKCAAPLTCLAAMRFYAHQKQPLSINQQSSAYAPLTCLVVHALMHIWTTIVLHSQSSAFAPLTCQVVTCAHAYPNNHSLPLAVKCAAPLPCWAAMCFDVHLKQPLSIIQQSSAYAPLTCLVVACAHAHLNNQCLSFTVKCAAPLTRWSAACSYIHLKQPLSFMSFIRSQMRCASDLRSCYVLLCIVKAATIS